MDQRTDQQTDGHTDGRTDGLTDGPTKRGVESRSMRLKTKTLCILREESRRRTGKR